MSISNDESNDQASEQQDLNEALKANTDKLGELADKLEGQDDELAALENSIATLKSNPGPPNEESLAQLNTQKKQLEDSIKATLEDIEATQNKGYDIVEKHTQAVEQPSSENQVSNSEEVQQAIHRVKQLKSNTVESWQSMVAMVNSMCDSMNDTWNALADVKRQVRGQKKQENKSIRAANSVYQGVNTSLTDSPPPDVTKDLNGTTELQRAKVFKQHFHKHVQTKMVDTLESQLKELKDKQKGIGHVFHKKDYAVLAEALGQPKATERELAMSIAGTTDKPLLNPTTGSTELEKKILSHMEKYTKEMKKAQGQGGKEARRTRFNAEQNYGALAKLGKALVRSHQIMEKKCDAFCKQQEEKFKNPSISATTGNTDAPEQKPDDRKKVQELKKGREEAEAQKLKDDLRKEGVSTEIAGQAYKASIKDSKINPAGLKHAAIQCEKQVQCVNQINNNLPEGHPWKDNIEKFTLSTYKGVPNSRAVLKDGVPRKLDDPEQKNQYYQAVTKGTRGFELTPDSNAGSKHGLTDQNDDSPTLGA